MFLKLLDRAIGALFVILVMQNQQPIAQWIRDDDAALSSVRRRFADIWHVLLILYLVVSFAVWALEIPGGFEFILRASLLSVVIITTAKTIHFGEDKSGAAPSAPVRLMREDSTSEPASDDGFITDSDEG